MDHDPLTAWDLPLATWMRGHASPLGDQIAVLISAVGSPVAMTILAVVVGTVLLYQHRWLFCAGWSAAFAGGGLLDWTLKRLVHRSRPSGAARFLHGASFSFPSGHATGSLIGYGMLVSLLVTSWPWAGRHRRAVIVGTALLVILIGLSRLYLGVHFLSDVIGGYMIGGVWLAVCLWGTAVARRRAGTP